MSTVPQVTLNTGVRMPQLGFGVWQVDNASVGEAVRTALEVGYRSIDTAAAYGNEQGVGEAVGNSGLARDEVFVTSKLWNDAHGYDAALRAFDATLDQLKFDYLDLYLIHWPVPSQDRYVETWKALERLYADGKVGAIGVSNFHPRHLQRILDEASIIPAVNQVELHPNLSQAELRQLHAQRGIATEAWSPLGQGNLLSDPTLGAMADSYGKSPAQIILRWHLQLGNIAIPKSVTPSRIRDNFDVFDFELSGADVERVSALNKGQRFGPDPENVGG